MQLRICCLAVILMIGISSIAHAETRDDTFATDGRLVDYDSVRDYKSVAAFTADNGNVIRVMTYTDSCGACIVLRRSDASGVTTQVRTLDAGLMSVVAAAMDQNGRIVVVGSTTASGSLSQVGVVRLNRDLSNDTSFAGDGGMFFPSALTEVPTSVAIDRNNRIVVAGRRYLSPGDTDFVVLRVNENGTPDTTFNGSGRRLVSFDLGNTELYDEARAIAIGNDGKIVVVGTAYDAAILRNRVAMARLNPNGALDTSYCTDCSITSHPSINNGRALYYFGANTGHEDVAAAVDTTSDGGFVIAGTTFSDSGTLRRAAIARFYYDGNFRSEKIEAGVGGSAAFTAVKVVQSATTRIYAAGPTANNDGWMMLQAFESNLAPIDGYGNGTWCLLSNSAICFWIHGNIGDGIPAMATAPGDDPASVTLWSGESPTGNTYDVGPDLVTAITIDAQGRPLVSGQGKPVVDSYRHVITARFTNSSGPLPDRIFQHGFQ